MEYSAFISYRHAPADIAAAEEVQHRLERMHVPKKVRESTGRQKIGRIFRDKEELPITSDLSENIEDALDHSEYLIVICSTATKESLWVEREIRHFLSKHDRRHILTVLVNGEPSDVIPEVILNENVTRETDGETQAVEQIYEPLSCDFRVKGRSTRRAELLRLAAALLGCPYDELAQRERQYKRRRALIASSVAAVLVVTAIGYLIWSNLQIRSNYERAEENYRQAIENRAQYLANASLQALNADDRELALHLALAALPEDENTPVSANVEYALSMASGAYLGDRDSPLYYRQLRNYQMPGDIIDVVTNSDGTILYLAYDDSALRAIRPLEDTTLFDVRLNNPNDWIRSLEFGAGGQVFAFSGYGLTAIDGQSGDLLWEKEYYETTTISNDLSDYRTLEQKNKYLCGDRGIWCVCQSHVNINASENSDWNLRVSLLDPQDGSVLEQSEPIPYDGENNCYDVYLHNGSSSLALVCSEKNTYSVYLYRFQENSLLKLYDVPENVWITSLCFSEDGSKLYFYGVQTGVDVSTIYSSNGEDSVFLYTRGLYVFALDTQSGELLWQSDFESNRLNYYGLKNGLKLRTTSTGEPALACVYGDSMVFLNAETGEKLCRCYCGSEIVYLRPAEDLTTLVILRSGEIGLISDGEDMLFFMKVFHVELDAAYYLKETGSYVVMTGDKTISVYTDVVDETQIKLEGDDSPAYLSAKSWTGSEYCVLLDDDCCLWLYSLADHRLIKKVLPDESGSYNNDSDYYLFLGADSAEDYLYLFYKVYSGESVFYRLRLSDGELETLPITAEGITTAALIDDALYLQIYSWRQSKLARLELDAASVEEAVWTVDLPKQTFYCNSSFVSQDCLLLLEKNAGYDSEDTLLLCYDQNGTLLYSLSEARKTEVKDVALSADRSLLAVAEATAVTVYDRDGSIRYTLSLPERKVCSVFFLEGDAGTMLITLEVSGLLCKYRAADGALLSGIELSVQGENEVRRALFEQKDGLLYILPLPYGLEGTLSIVDVESWALRGEVPHCFGIDSKHDRFLCLLEDREGRICPAVYSHHSIDELRQLAETLLGGRSMSEEDRALYGLTD